MSTMRFQLQSIVLTALQQGRERRQACGHQRTLCQHDEDSRATAVMGLKQRGRWLNVSLRLNVRLQPLSSNGVKQKSHQKGSQKNKHRLENMPHNNTNGKNMQQNSNILNSTDLT